MKNSDVCVYFCFIKEGFMKKRFLSILGVLMALSVISTSAYSWNFATHAYIAEKIGKRLLLANANEMYGTMSPDLFNFNFALMSDNTLRAYTHGIPPEALLYPPYLSPNENFMEVWYKANWGLKKNLAFGYVSHNDAWGFDYVAHWQAFPPPNPPAPPVPFPLDMPDGYSLQPPGYIIYLAAALDYGLASGPQGNVWEILNLQDDYASRLMFCHNIVEYAGDLVLKKSDPFIGKKLITAAALRTPEFTKLLKAAIPNLFSPETGMYYHDLINATEPEYRKMIAQYGLILMMPQKIAIALLADQLATLAIDYFEFMNPWAPPGSFDPLKPQLVEFAKGALTAAIGICEQPPFPGFPSYMQEINLIGLPWVLKQLALHGVIY
jgi:hypothetical protein